MIRKGAAAGARRIASAMVAAAFVASDLLHGDMARALLMCASGLAGGAILALLRQPDALWTALDGAAFGGSVLAGAALAESGLPGMEYPLAEAWLAAILALRPGSLPIVAPGGQPAALPVARALSAAMALNALLLVVLSAAASIGGAGLWAATSLPMIALAALLAGRSLRAAPPAPHASASLRPLGDGTFDLAGCGTAACRVIIEERGRVARVGFVGILPSGEEGARVLGGLESALSAQGFRALALEGAAGLEEIVLSSAGYRRKDGAWHKVMTYPAATR